MIKLQKIEIVKPLKYKPIDKKYYILTSDFNVRLHTSEGILDAYMKKGWITDLRSGSDAINWVIPKKGNDEYNAIILFHDFSWSGWITRALSNELLRQGIILSGTRGEKVADIVKFTVDHFGHYYNLEDKLPEPYTVNRELESFKWYK
jgi:hypothetical protein